MSGIVVICISSMRTIGAQIYESQCQVVVICISNIIGTLEQNKIDFWYQLYKVNILMTTQLLDVPQDVLDLIVSNKPLKFSKVSAITRELSLQYITKAATQLQRWYRSRRLGKYTPEYCTKNTMIRYYIVRYEKIWLQNMPKDMIRKCNIVVDDEDYFFNESLISNGLVREVTYFLHKYGSLEKFLHFGW